jgi:SAM-dependent MidA family methyltransferase
MVADATGGPADGVRRGRLTARMRAAADDSGFLRFDRFVEIALYSPGAGYYAREETPWGPAGDYYTAAHASPLFGASVALRVRSEFERLGRPASFRVVEVGPGDGTLAVGVLRALDPDVRVDYVLVEQFPASADRLRTLVETAVPSAAGRIRTAPSVASLGAFRGLVIGNELLDAVPFRRLVARGGAYRELGVDARGERVVWREAPLADPVPLPALPPGIDDGHIVEVSPLAEAFVREVADHLADGALILIDYGDEEGELVRRFPRGSLQAIRGHRVLDDPLETPGAADLSAHVNFSRIRAAARATGLVEVAYAGQADALGRWGFERARAAALAAAASEEERVRVALGAKNLLFGFERFRVLEVATPGRATALPA